MKNLTIDNIRRELARQKGRLVDLLENIDAKNARKLTYKKQVDQRRKKRPLKNNGRGRPALKLKPPSREDEARRLQYTAQIALLDQVLSFDFDSVEELPQWLDAAKKVDEGPAASEEERISRDHRNDMLGRLMRQLTYQPRQQLPPAALKPWAEADVYGFLRVLLHIQQGRLDAFARIPVRTLGEQDIHDRERARTFLLQRVVSSNCFTSARLFLQRANIIRVDVVLPNTGTHNTQIYAAAWREAADQVVTRLKAEYRMEEGMS